MKDTYIYRLPLDKIVDKDLIDWIDSFPSKKKAEIIRYALRYYMSQLPEGEIYIMPNQVVKNNEKKKEVKKRPKVSLRNITDD